MNDDELLFYISQGENEALVLIHKDDGKWREWFLCGERPYGIEGKTYMSYLEPKDILSWLSKDYDDIKQLTREWLDNNDLAINYDHMKGFYDVDWDEYGIEVDEE